MLTLDERKRLKALEKEKDSLKKQIKDLQNNQKRQKDFRLQRKRKNEEILLSNPELASQLKIHPKKGKPPISEEYPELLSTIIKIATHGAAADEKRRCENLRTMKTLNDLTKALQNEGFDIGRSTVYYHLQPKNIRTIDGKKHITTVPVKLIKAEKDHHKSHPDSMFCTATINNLMELVSFLGPDEVTIISQDDKAKVPIGISAANCQAPVLMNLEYRVKLPDHNWIVAENHKLIPSVYAALMLESEGYGDRKCIQYSGPTYIATRSGKHSKSTAYSHARDFERLYEIDSFKPFLFNLEGDCKPIVILLVDGGPDENPRYQKTIEIGIHHFIKRNLDALFIATNAPHRSAFNPVERRMAPLSRQLSGLVLPFDHFGSHLDNRGRTTDLALEYENFKFAGEILSEVFGKVVIDGFDTFAEFIEEEYSEIKRSNIIKKSQGWISNHLRSTQYMTQIVKCKNSSCCASTRGNYVKVINNQFLPAPIPLGYSPKIEFVTASKEKFKYSSLFQFYILRQMT